jgi:hypothetical protein
MKYNYLVSSYNDTMMKYKKYFSRLQRDINNGSFIKLSAKRKNFLVRKVDELRAKLASMQPKLAGVVAGAGLLLALNASQAQAQFVLNYTKNPFGQELIVQNAYSWTQQTVGDLDQDGDQDLIITDGGTGFYYYQNTGTNSAPAFTQQTGTNNPLDAVSDFHYNSPQLADIDGDGDLDLVNGGRINGTGLQLSYYKNTGTVSSAVFVAQTGTDNPFPALSGYTGYASVSVVDIDADGDKDVFIVDGKNGVAFFYKNTGTATAPVFTETTADNPFPSGNITSPGYTNNYLFTTFADIDGDGDQDAMLGQSYNEIIYYKNTGTATAAVLSMQGGTNNPFANFTARWQDPSFADLNNDGKLDLIIGGESEMDVIFNQGTVTAASFDFIPGISIGDKIKPVFVDVDGDGDKDAVFGSVGSQYNGLYYYKNTGTTSAPIYTNTTGTNNPFTITNGQGNAQAPAFTDIDGDGDTDLLLGTRYGTFIYYENTGTATAPVYTLSSGTNYPLFGEDIGGSSTPVFVDLDNDGDEDIVSGENYSGLFYYMNTGTASAPVFTAQTGTSNLVAIPLTNHTDYYTPTFVNIDGDSDLDLLVGTSYSGMLYYKNTGTASAPIFTAQTGTDNPYALITSNNNYYQLSEAFMDIDNDGDLDLFVGKGDEVRLYENLTPHIVNTPTATLSATFSGTLSAYPNPVKDVLSFSLNDAIGSNMKVSVLDMSGSEMMTQSFENSGATMNINVSGLNAGIYVLKLSSDAKAGVVKFVKQ